MSYVLNLRLNFVFAGGRRPPYWYGIILQMCILSTHFVLRVRFCISLAFCSDAGDEVLWVAS